MEPVKPHLYTATVDWVRNAASKFYLARFILVHPATIAFRAGQFVIFQIGPPKLRHTLSIASAPAATGSIEVIQSVEPMGGGSRWLLALKPGDQVQFLGTLGKFLLRDQSLKPKVMVATGCGIAPLRSMLGDYLSREPNVPVRLYWGLRYETDVFLQEELEQLKQAYPNFTYTITLSRPGATWSRIRGRVTDHVVQEVPNVTDSEFYLCGNRAMIIDVRQQLTTVGVPADQIITETFY